MYFFKIVPNTAMNFYFIRLIAPLLVSVHYKFISFNETQLAILSILSFFYSFRPDLFLFCFLLFVSTNSMFSMVWFFFLRTEDDYLLFFLSWFAVSLYFKDF